MACSTMATTTQYRSGTILWIDTLAYNTIYPYVSLLLPSPLQIASNKTLTMGALTTEQLVPGHFGETLYMYIYRYVAIETDAI